MIEFKWVEELKLRCTSTSHTHTSQRILSDFSLEDDPETITEADVGKKDSKALDDEGTRSAHNASTHIYDNIYDDECCSSKSASIVGGRKDAHTNFRDLGS